MAGDWIPMRVDLADDPAVITIAREVNLDEFGVVGRLHRLWVWANKHLADGHARNVTVDWIDRYLSTPGFAAAMLHAGWLRDRSGGIEFPKFDHWNSQGAKRRLLASRRKQEERSRKCHAPDVTKTRPEKSREENKDPPNPPAGGPDPEKRKRKPPDPGADSVPVPAALDTPEFRAAWGEWLADRTARKKTVTARAAKMQLDRLAEFGVAWAVSRIRKAIANGWTGLVFDDEAPPNGTHPKPQKVIPMTNAPTAAPMPGALGGDA